MSQFWGLGVNIRISKTSAVIIWHFFLFLFLAVLIFLSKLFMSRKVYFVCPFKMLVSVMGSEHFKYVIDHGDGCHIYVMPVLIFVPIFRGCGYVCYAIYRGRSVYVPSQWEKALHRNAVSHWRGAHTEWPLNLRCCIPFRATGESFDEFVSQSILLC